jgi:hypothetical protein
MSLFLIIYGGLSMIFTTNLLIYHTGLVNNNMTTKEELKKHFKNPYGDFYSRNCSLNWRNVICPIINKKSILDILKWENEIPNETEEKDDGVKGEKFEKNEKFSIRSENSENRKDKKVSTTSSNIHKEIDHNEIEIKNLNNPKNDIKSVNGHISQEEDYADVVETSSLSHRKNIPQFEYKLEMNNTSILNSK